MIQITTKKMRRRMALLGLAAGTSLLSFAAVAGGGDLSIVELARYDKGADVRPAIKAECKLEQRTPEFVSSYAKKHFDKIIMVKSAKGVKGKVLDMKIDTVMAPGGGAWTGRKYVQVSGTLKDNGKLIGSFEAQRSSGAGYRSTCSLLGRSIKVIGKDVAAWLEKPTKGAKLGEAK